MLEKWSIFGKITPISIEGFEMVWSYLKPSLRNRVEKLQNPTQAENVPKWQSLDNSQTEGGIDV